MTVVRATVTDLDAMLAIERASHPQPWTREGLEEEILRDQCWVVHDEGRVAAYLVMWIVLDELQIQNVTTDPSRRRKGFARALLAHVIARAGERLITLEVRASNAAAMALYESFGFKRVGLRRGYYTNGDDAVLMERR